VADQAGRVLGTKEFPATAAGYAAALAWMRGHGDLARVGVEGTGSYGAGLARYLATHGIEVTEVIRPNRQARRRRPQRRGPHWRETYGREPPKRSPHGRGPP
jgi:transposase